MDSEAHFLLHAAVLAPHPQGLAQSQLPLVSLASVSLCVSPGQA